MYSSRYLPRDLKQDKNQHCTTKVTKLHLQQEPLLLKTTRQQTFLRRCKGRSNKHTDNRTHQANLQPRNKIARQPKQPHEPTQSDIERPHSSALPS
eukprot:95195-Amphidinium_carterae.1